MKKVTFLTVLAALMLFDPTGAFAQEQQSKCQQCVTAARATCDTGCDASGVTNGFERCASGCVRSRCVSQCGSFHSFGANSDGGVGSDPLPGGTVVSGPSSFRDHSGECGSCLRRQEFGECRYRCTKDNTENVTACRRLCAKGLCADRCALPAKQSRTKTQRITKQDCGECKLSARGYCSDRCGEDKERPGYTACHVSCVSERCFGTCSPEPD